MMTKVEVDLTDLDANGVPINLVKDVRLADAVAESEMWNKFRKNLEKQLMKDYHEVKHD